LSWGDILATAPAPHREPLIRTWRSTCLELQERSGSLRPWERGFVGDLPNFHRISVKQRYILDQIAERVLGRGA
jgi:hypothetical protein